jgi:hypothetical protein
LSVSTPVSKPASRLFGLLTAGLLGYQTVQANALSSKVEPTTQHVIQSPITTSVPPVNAEIALTDSVRVITGRVIEQATNTAVPGVYVIIKEISKGANTDAEGRFQINVPTEFTSERITLQIGGIGYLTQEIQLYPEKSDPPLISLNEDLVALNTVYVVGGYKKLTFFQRLRNRLRGNH